MILTPKIWARLAALVLAVALLQVVFFSKIELFGSSPDGAAVAVMALGLLGGSLSGAVAGFSIGLLIDVLLLQTLGAFAATLMAVGYVSGRYREGLGVPPPGLVPALGGAMTMLASIAFAAVQIGTGVDAGVSAIVVRDAVVTALLGTALALPVFILVRLVVRPALVEDGRSGRRTIGARAAGTRS